MHGLAQSVAFVMFFGMVPLTQLQIFDPSGAFSQSQSPVYLTLGVHAITCNGL